ncbi:MAG: DUF2892 domain-containing protein [Pseudomonadota bacterium]
MSRNEGSLDRALRGLAGIALIAAVLYVQIANPVFYWGAILVGAILLITAVTGFCPAYRILGLKTCREC